MKTQVEGFRLSTQQRQIWKFWKNDQNCMMRTQCAVRIEGDLQLDVLQQAFVELVNRHEILRTTFYSVAGMTYPLQVIADRVIPQIEVQDWSGMEEQQQTSELDRLFANLFAVPIDVTKDTMLGATVVQMAERQHVLIISQPALFGDASLYPLLKDLLRVYEAMLHGEELETPEEIMQYTLVSEWLNQLLEEEDGEHGRQYWAKQNVSSVAASSIYGEKQHGDEMPFAPVMLQVPMKSERLMQMAKQTDGSLSAFLLTCWQLLICTFSTSSNVLIGVAMDGRTDEDFVDALGPFTKYVPLLQTVDSKRSFAEMMVQNSEDLKEMYEWQECFSWDQVEKLAGTATEQGFFAYGFHVQELFSSFEEAGLTVRAIQQQAYVDRFALQLFGLVQDAELCLHLTYDATRYEEQDVLRLVSHLQTLIEHALQEPETPLGKIKLMGAADAQQVLVAFNKTGHKRVVNGKDLSEVDVYLLNNQLQPVPIGVAGNLYIDAKDAELEAVQFVDFEFVGEKRLVRTGDVARYLQDGTIEWLGQSAEASEASDSNTMPFVAPRTEVEKTLAQIFSEVLQVEEVSIHDSFFELGGHSLLATQVVSRMRAEFQFDFSLRVIFEARTIAELAKRVEGISSETLSENTREAAEDLKPIPRLPKQEAYELSHSQERLWFTYQFASRSKHGSIAGYILEGNLEIDTFLRAFQEVMARHGIMRTTISERDGSGWQVVHDDRMLTCEVIDLRHLEEAEQEQQIADVVIKEWTTPFDLANELFFRYSLFQLAEQKHMLFLCAHHMGYDGWSAQVFLHDLNVLYSNFKQGNSVQLPPALQYTDFAKWQNKRLESGHLNSQRDYWRAKLAEDIAPPMIPTDQEIPQENGNPLDLRVMTIDAELTAKLRTFAEANGSTLYATVLAGLKAWFSILTRETTVTIGSTLSGRTHPDLEGLFGPLINPVAMRTDLAGNPTYLEIVKRTTHTAYEAYANQDYPYDLLIQDLRAGGMKTPALYSVVFIGQNANPKDLGFGDICVTPYQVEDFAKGRESEVSSLIYDDVSNDKRIMVDLFLTMTEVGTEIVIDSKYNVEKLHPETVDHFLQQIQFVLQQFVNEPTQRMSRLQLQNQNEEDELDELF